MKLRKEVSTCVLSVLFAIPLSSCSEKVFICTGPTAKAYHSTDGCMGLGRCQGDIIEVSKDEAEKYRKPCGICCKTRISHDEMTKESE